VVLILLWLQNSEAMVSIDMPAGPSEVLVIADKYANPVHVAADLLSQVHIFNDSHILLCSVGSCRGHVFSLKF
jgi:histidinol dehydrogenase